MSETASVSALFYYPVKSARGIATARAALSSTGLAGDRQWMVVDAQLRFLTQRSHPHMARIVPHLRGGNLMLSYPQLPDLTVPAHADGETLTVRIWGDLCVATTQGQEADEWLTRAIGDPVRLVRARAGARVASAKYAGTTRAPIGFPDGYPLLICNAASLSDLNARLPQPVPMERFRPNLVLSGLAPWAEDRIASISIGAVHLRLVKPCTRCGIPTRDHLTGERSVDVLRTLRNFRFDRELRGVTFGINAVIERGVGELIERDALSTVAYRT
jgi:uncharacterized protein YcbX